MNDLSTIAIRIAENNGGVLPLDAQRTLHDIKVLEAIAEGAKSMVATLGTSDSDSVRDFAAALNDARVEHIDPEIRRLTERLERAA